MKILILLLLNCAGLTPNFSFAANSPSIGKAVLVSGEVFVTSADQTKKPLKAGDPLALEDLIVTPAGGRARIVLGKTAALEIKSDTRLKLNQADGKDWRLQLEKGAVLSVVKNPEKRPNHFVMRTRSATMGVRGTMFYAQDSGGLEEGAKPVVFCLCMGEMHVESADGKSSMNFKSKHHDRLVQISALKAPLSENVRDVPAGTDPNHTDSELQELDALLKK